MKYAKPLPGRLRLWPVVAHRAQIAIGLRLPLTAVRLTDRTEDGADILVGQMAGRNACPTPSLCQCPLHCDDEYGYEQEYEYEVARSSKRDRAT